MSTLPQVVFASPRKLPKANDLNGRVVVLDIAFAADGLGKGFDKTTGRFIEALGPRLAAWVDLGGPWSTALSLAARDRGLLLPPGPRFSASGVLDRFARIPITWEPALTAEAMARLGSAWRALHAGERSSREHLDRSAVV